MVSTKRCIARKACARVCATPQTYRSSGHPRGLTKSDAEKQTRINKRPGEVTGPFVWNKQLGSDLLSHAECTLSSAQSRFTVLFGMGRSGTNSLWPPSLTCRLAGCAMDSTQQTKPIQKKYGLRFHARRMHEGVSFLRESPKPSNALKHSRL